MSQTFEETVDYVLGKMREVMIDRQRKYGPGNITRHGKLGLRVRIGDKLERLDHSEGKDFADESEGDAWLDIANYGLIGVMVHEQIWGRPLDETDSRTSYDNH